MMALMKDGSPAPGEAAAAEGRLRRRKMGRSGRQNDLPVSPGITATKILMAVNIVIFAVLALRGNTQDGTYMLRYGALWVPYLLEGQFYRLLTAAFLHFSFIHLFNNMLLLFFMGDVLESEIGSVRFTILYLLSGIAGNAASAVSELQTGDYSISAGASGAVYGVLGALIFLLICNRGRVSYLTGGRMVFFVLYSLYTGLTSSGVNNTAHAGGFIAGFLLAGVMVLTMGRDRKRWRRS